MLLVPVNSAMCDLTADGRHWGLIVLIISSPTSHILFIDPTYVEDDYAREFPANQTPVAPSSSNLFTIVSKIYSVLSMCETRNIEFIPSNIKHTLTDSGFCVLEYIDLLMNLDQSVVIRWTDVKELLGNTTIAVHESRSKILEHFETFSPVDLSHVPKMPAVPPKLSAINLLPPTVSKPVPASLTGLRLASTKASTGLSTKKSKPKLASPRGSPLIKQKESRTTNSLVSTGITPQTNISVTTVSEPVPSSPTPKPSITEQEPNKSQKFCLIEIKSVISDPERLNLKVVRVKQEPEVDEEIESTSEGIPQIQDTTFEIQRDPDLDPIVSISLQFTHDKFANETHLFTRNVSEISLSNCVVHTFTTEKSMLTNFITFLNLNKPSLLISYDWHLDTFPFLVSRFKKLEIDIDYTIDDYISSLPSWFHRWCKPTEIGPFYSLDLNSVLKKLYVFRRGRFLENVTTIMMDMNNHSRTFESFDKENIFLKRIFHSLDNPLVSDEEIKVKTDERQNKAPSVKLKPKAVMEIRLLAELTKLNELWESKTSRDTSRATLLLNSINKLFLIQYLLFDLLDEKKQKLRERSPMKVVKQRLDNVVSKTKANWMESCAKRAHQVRVRGTHMLKHFFVTKFHNSLIFDKVKEIQPPTVKEEIETDTEVSDTEQTEILSEEFVPQQLEEETELPVTSDPDFGLDRTIESEISEEDSQILEEDSIENETGEPELDLLLKLKLPNLNYQTGELTLRRVQWDNCWP
ncbi:hypothetical protein GEMRC1_007535 [Eukaryota sp. GEM-RC1]